MTEENQEIFQRAAVLACKSPFEISHLDPIDPISVTGTTEDYDSQSEGETENFTIVNGLIW